MMNFEVSVPHDKIHKGLQFFKENGLWPTAALIQKNLSLYVRRYIDAQFDKKYNVDTSGVIPLGDLTCRGGDAQTKASGYRYEPTPRRALKFAFSLLPPDLSQFTFVDFGSGKGRVLLYASNFNFRQIIGVEFTEELHEIAQRNIVNYRNARQRCFDLQSRCCDAVDFVLPSGKLV